MRDRAFVPRLAAPRKHGLTSTSFGYIGPTRIGNVLRLATQRNYYGDFPGMYVSVYPLTHMFVQMRILRVYDLTHLHVCNLAVGTSNEMRSFCKV